MQYRVPKTIGLALWAALLLLAAALSLALLTAMDVGYTALNLAATLTFLFLSAAMVSRFVLMGAAYRLGEAYEDDTLYLYRLQKGNSYLAGKVTLTGKESLIPLDRAGRRVVKKRECRGDMTANLIPDKRYALLYQEDGVDCYLILELNPVFVHALKERIALVKACTMEL